MLLSCGFQTVALSVLLVATVVGTTQSDSIWVLPMRRTERWAKSGSATGPLYRPGGGNVKVSKSRRKKEAKAAVKALSPVVVAVF